MSALEAKIDRILDRVDALHEFIAVQARIIAQQADLIASSSRATQTATAPPICTPLTKTAITPSDDEDDRTDVKPPAKKVKKEVKFHRGIPLPFALSRVRFDDCQAIKNDHLLYTQCDQKKVAGKAYCASCIKSMEKSNVNEPKLGTVRERVLMGHKFYKSKNSPLAYYHVLHKKGVTLDEAKEYWAERGVELTADDLAYDTDTTPETPRHWTDEDIGAFLAKIDSN
jgi:hypothetical protein